LQIKGPVLIRICNRPICFKNCVDQIAKTHGILPEAFDILLPGSLKVVGDSVDMAAMTSYLSRAFERAKRVGAKTIVFGSGGSRRIPDGFSRETAFEQVLSFVQAASDIAASHGLVIVIEPLNKKECNFINDIGEALTIAQQSGRASVKVLSDLYHVSEENQPFEDTGAVGSYLHHVHVACTHARMAPSHNDVAMLTHYFSEVIRAGGCKRISVEANFPSGEIDYAVSLDVLKVCWLNAEGG